MDLTQWLTAVCGQCFCHHTPPTSTQLSSHFLLSRHTSNETMTQSSILWGMIMMTKQRFMHTSVWQSGLWPLLMQKDGSVIVIMLSNSTAHFKHISYTIWKWIIKPTWPVLHPHVQIAIKALRWPYSFQDKLPLVPSDLWRSEPLGSSDEFR